MDQVAFAHGPIPPRALLRIVGGELDGDPVGGRPADPAGVLVRYDAVVAIPALENLVIRIALIPLVFAEAIAVQRFRTDRGGEGLRLKRFFGMIVRGHLDDFLGRTDQHLQQEVGHHQLLADVVESLRCLVVLETPRRFDGLVSGDAVAVEVVESGNHLGVEIRVLDIKQITQRVAQLELVQPPDHRLAAGALACRVGLLEHWCQPLDHLRGVFEGRLRLFLRRQLAEVELIENALPCFECLQIG